MAPAAAAPITARLVGIRPAWGAAIIGCRTTPATSRWAWVKPRTVRTNRLMTSSARKAPVIRAFRRMLRMATMVTTMISSTAVGIGCTPGRITFR